MAAPGVTVDVSDVRRAFARIEPVFREEIAFAIAEGGEDVVRLARELVPVRLGNLRDFIAYTVDKATSTGRVGIRTGRISTPRKNSASQWPSVYGRFVHEGTRHIAPNPFMVRAAELARGPVQQHYNAAINRSVKVLHGEYLAAGGPRKAA